MHGLIEIFFIVAALGAAFLVIRGLIRQRAKERAATVTLRTDAGGQIAGYEIRDNQRREAETGR